MAISQEPGRYPAEFLYDEQAKELRVGDGVFAPVSQEAWAYEVSGLRVISSWLGYRMKARAGRSTSPLDTIQPERWTTDLTDELLDLLWVIERTIELQPQQEALLAEIAEGGVLLDDDLKSAPEDRRTPPGVVGPASLEGFEEPGEHPGSDP